MMMMAELIQGQASVAQPGTKDDFADTIRRVRQVKCLPGNTSAMLTGLRSGVVKRANQGQDLGRSAPEYKHSSCTV